MHLIHNNTINYFNYTAPFSDHDQDIPQPKSDTMYASAYEAACGDEPPLLSELAGLCDENLQLPVRTIRFPNRCLLPSRFSDAGEEGYMHLTSPRERVAHFFAIPFLHRTFLPFLSSAALHLTHKLTSIH